MAIDLRQRIQDLGRPLQWIAFIDHEESQTLLKHFVNQKKIGCLFLNLTDLPRLTTWLKQGIKPEFILIEITQLDPWVNLAQMMEHIPKAIKVIATGTRTDIGYYRQLQKIGIMDYLFLPLNHLLLDEVYKKATSVDHDVAKPKQCIGIIGARAGVGVTTMTINLAYLWSTLTDERCCILDLDPQRGDLGMQLKINENSGLHEVLNNVERIDEVLLNSLMIEKTHNLYAVTNDWALTNSFSSLSLSELTFTHLFNLLYQQVTTLFLDLSSMNELSLLQLVLNNVTDVVLVTDLSLSSIRDTLARFAWLRSQLPHLSPFIAVNTVRPLKDQRIAYEHLKSALQHEVEHLLPFCNDLQRAILDGEIYAQRYPKKEFTQGLKALAGCFVQHQAQPHSPSFWQKMLRKLQ
jgi:pilus assembly protein CpaE